MRFTVLVLLAGTLTAQATFEGSARPIGTSCGPGLLLPRMFPPPTVGLPFTVIVTPIRSSVSLATVSVGGYIPETWMGPSAPPGCFCHVAIMDTYRMFTVGFYREWTLFVPNTPSLAGATFSMQAVVYDSSVPLGWYVTNGMHCQVGG